MTRYILSILLLATSLGLSAQEKDTIVRNYAMDEEWYVQAQFGPSYLAAENTKYVKYGHIAKGEFAAAIGKRFTPVWGMRLQGQFGGDTGAFYGHDSKTPTYDFTHSSFNLIGSFNISEFINLRKDKKERAARASKNSEFSEDSEYSENSPRRYNRRWNVSALFGLGIAFSYFDGITTPDDIIVDKVFNADNRSYFSPFLGVEVAYSIDRHWDVMAELGSHWMGKMYNGMYFERDFWLRKIDQSIPLMFGARYTFRKPKRKFKPYYRELPVVVEPQPAPLPVAAELKEHGNRQEADKPDCYTVEELVELSKDRQDIRGKELCCGESVLFDYGKADLRVFSTFYLDKVVELMQMQPVTLVLKGLGGKHANTNLTDRRMKAIRDYLAERGIDRDRLVYQYVPVGTPCVTNMNIRLELMQYPEQSMDECFEIDELLLMARKGETVRGKQVCGVDMVHFDVDKSIIKPTFAAYLDKVALLMSYTDLNLIIMGHTDYNGSVDYNYDLSERRSKAVLEYLHDKGVAYNRMKFSYHSKLMPYTDNDTEKGRSINRRVEFIIY